MVEKTATEPNLDEILGSIRRIITEGDPPSPTTSASARLPRIEPADDVLLLTERAPPLAELLLDDAPIAAEPAIEPVAEPSSTEPVHAAEQPPPQEISLMTDSPVSSAASEDAAPAAASASIFMPSQNRTLEDVVTELLAPMVQKWLDENLEALVKARVDEEVARLFHTRVK